MSLLEDRDAIVATYNSLRSASRRFFDGLTPEGYTYRPIELRHPFIFYEGHLPGFAFLTLVRRALGRPAIDEEMEALFERGIDPETSEGVGTLDWPERNEVLRFGGRTEDAVRRALLTAVLIDDHNPLLARGQAVFNILEHEAMHQETLRYMLHQLPRSMKQGSDAPTETEGDAPMAEMIRIPSGTARLGADLDEIDFGWDNEYPAREVSVPGFSISNHSVTNDEFLEFVRRGGYSARELWSTEAWTWLEESGTTHPAFWKRSGDDWLWTGMYEDRPLPATWPVWVSHAEASAYARWKGMRLPTEAEYHRAAFGSPSGDRPFPWGSEPPESRHGNFNFERHDPVPAGSRPDGASAWGVHDLMGNGWEWTSTAFDSHPGFEPMASYPQYSADFFDGRHYVLKGASPATSSMLLRRTFRNWFRGTYPYVYAKFRLAE